MKELFSISFKELEKVKKLPPRDQGHYLPFNSYPHGSPLGGFGAGTIGRSPYGDFNIWHLKVGAHIAEELKACNFHCYQKIKDQKFTRSLTARNYSSDKLQKFGQPFSINDGEYSASFPKSKYTFNSKDLPVEISCEQFSPVLPNNYRESSYPLAVFEHTLHNKTAEEVEVSIMLSWANLTGWGFQDQRPGVQDNWFSFIKNNKNQIHKRINKKLTAGTLSGVVMGQQNKQAQFEMDGEIAIATIAPSDGITSTKNYFYTEGDGSDLYSSFADNGVLSNQNPPHMLEHQSYGSAIAVKVTLKPGETKQIPFFLSWDLPIVHFGTGVDRYKYYTNYFNKSGKNSWKIITEAAKKHTAWSKNIDSWHTDIIEQSKVGKTFKKESEQRDYFKMLINELYFLTDGGSFWDADSGSFGLLECFDYPFYETLDVRFYGSFPLLKFWPEIELKIMEDFAQTITREDPTPTRFHFHTDDPTLPLPKAKNERLLCSDKRMVKGSCPHDLGSPKENPFKIAAAYTWQNTNYWKDLNTKFVLLCYRNYKVTGNREFLQKVWPAMGKAMEYMKKMDKDKDGIPENSGYPDQTYDNWIMNGVSAYCGSLWLAALQVMIIAAEELGDKVEQTKWSKLLPKAKDSFEQKLWNGKYYDFCEGNKDIMADQLIGEWYLDLLAEPAVLPQDNIKTALKQIYKYNYKGTKKGVWGVVSGKQPNNKMVEAEQGRDVWVGANFALASLMAKNGLINESKQILQTMSKIIYGKGFFFRTPEGWDTNGEFTATMYMRPNSVWSLEF